MPKPIKGASAPAVTPRTESETVAALSAKCDLLSASLKQAGGELVDCAALMESYADWHGALFQAIQRYAKTDEGSLLEPMDIGDRSTVATLAGLGAYLADAASDLADRLAETADELQGAAA